MNEWPEPGYWRDPVTGRTRKATAREEREIARLFAKHRDIAWGMPFEKGPIPAAALDFIAGLGVDVDRLRDDEGIA